MRRIGGTSLYIAFSFSTGFPASMSHANVFRCRGEGWIPLSALKYGSKDNCILQCSLMHHPALFAYISLVVADVFPCLILSSPACESVCPIVHDRTSQSSHARIAHAPSHPFSLPRNRSIDLINLHDITGEFLPAIDLSCNLVQCGFLR